MPPKDQNSIPVNNQGITNADAPAPAADDIPEMSEPILDQPTTINPESQPVPEEPEEVVLDSSLEDIETSPSDKIQAESPGDPLSPAEPSEESDIGRSESPEIEPEEPAAESDNNLSSSEAQAESPERVSLTDLSSYKPQDGSQTVVNIQSAAIPAPDEAAKENVYTEICSQIIKEQEQIIGTLAVEQAQQVSGLTVDPVTYHCTVTGDGSRVIDDLIEQYRDFFGHAAVEVCKEAASKFITKLPADDLPASLR